MLFQVGERRPRAQRARRRGAAVVRADGGPAAHRRHAERATASSTESMLLLAANVLAVKFWPMTVFCPSFPVHIPD